MVLFPVFYYHFRFYNSCFCYYVIFKEDRAFATVIIISFIFFLLFEFVIKIFTLRCWFSTTTTCYQYERQYEIGWKVCVMVIFLLVTIKKVSYCGDVLFIATLLQQLLFQHYYQYKRDGSGRIAEVLLILLLQEAIKTSWRSRYCYR